MVGDVIEGHLVTDRGDLVRPREPYRSARPQSTVNPFPPCVWTAGSRVVAAASAAAISPRSPALRTPSRRVQDSFRMESEEE
jgi:hypothetical protein